MKVEVYICDCCGKEIDPHSAQAWGSAEMTARTNDGGYAFLDFCSLDCTRAYLVSIEEFLRT